MRAQGRAGEGRDQSEAMRSSDDAETYFAAILRSAFSDLIARGTLDGFLASLDAHELTRLHYDFELWARDDQLAPACAQGGGAWTALAPDRRPRRRQDAGRR